MAQNNTTKKRRAVIYTRLSDIGPGGRETAGLDRQQADCEQFAKAHGFEVVQSFREAGVSASSGVKRPEFENMLGFLEAGFADAVLVWRLDRLTRSAKDLERLLEIAQREKVTLYLIQEKTEAGPGSSMLFLRLGSIIAAEESRTMGIRIARSKLDRAKAGRHTGGGIRPYGWANPEKTKEVAAEKKMVRELVKSFVNGESCHSIAVDWNKRKVRSATGKRWNSSQLYNLLRSPRYVGKVLYQRKGSDPQQFQAQWKAFISENDWALVEAELERRANEPKNGGYHGRKHLLSGLLVCGSCGYKLLAWKGDKTHPALYFCARRTEHPERCGRTRILMSDADRFAAELVVRTLSNPLVAAATATGVGSSAVARKQIALSALIERRTRLEADVLKGKVQPSRAVRLAIRELEQEAEVIQGELSGARVGFGLKGRVVKSLSDWKSLPLLSKRFVLTGLFETLLVGKGGTREKTVSRLVPIFLTQRERPVRVDGRMILASKRETPQQRGARKKATPRP